MLAAARVPYYSAKSVLITYLRLPQLDAKTTADIPDGVHAYALETLSLGLLWLALHDSIKEGDGDRLILHWKLLLVVFKSADCPNYRKETVRLLHQHKHNFSERKCTQLMWSRFVNTKALTGLNIPSDLHIEHINRRIKSVLCHLGSNINPVSIARAANHCKQYIMFARPLSRKHQARLKQITVYTLNSGRTSHRCYKHLKR